MKKILIAKALIRHDGKYLLLKKAFGNASHPHGFWESAGGKLNENEDPKTGVLREIKEETGLSVRVIGEMKPFQFIRENIEYITHAFLCESTTRDVVLSSEHREYRWVLPSELDAVPDIIYRERFKKYIDIAEKMVKRK